MLTALLSVFLPLLGVIVVNALFWKLGAKMLRYGGVTWPLSFLVAATIVFASAFVRGVIAYAGLRLPVVLAFAGGAVMSIVLGAWCVHDRATLRDGAFVGWPGALQLSGLAIALSLLFSVLLLYALFTFTGGLHGTLS